MFILKLSPFFPHLHGKGKRAANLKKIRSYIVLALETFIAMFPSLTLTMVWGEFSSIQKCTQKSVMVLSGPISDCNERAFYSKYMRQNIHTSLKEN